MHILPKLKWGIWHVLEVTVSTPFSIITIISEEFLVNIPPYGGSCDISPTTGIILPITLLLSRKRSSFKITRHCQ